MPNRFHQKCDAPLALTMGDPAGIGIEIALKAWNARLDGDAIPPFFLLAPIDLVQSRAQILGLSCPVQIVTDMSETSTIFKDALPVRALANKVPICAGVPEAGAAPAIIESIASAVRLAHDGVVAGVVTNPIAKANLYAAGFQFPGHTEYLAELAHEHWGGAHRAVMMLAGPHLKVVPVTIHIPLKDVAGALSGNDILVTARITAQAMQRDFAIADPVMAFCGLNPHAGEEGKMGREEIEIIIPALDRLRAEGYRVTGPHPADTMFHSRARQTYDVAFSMYHDQGLVPLKTLDFERGVNVTLGLPFVRTSPDHGTAFDIAGTGKADAASLVEALKLAAKISANRGGALR